MKRLKKGRLGAPGKRRVPERPGDIKQARDRIAYLVKIGKMKPARKFACVVCGYTAAEYHHYKGYDVGCHELVEPMCRHHHALANMGQNGQVYPEYEPIPD